MQLHTPAEINNSIHAAPCLAMCFPLQLHLHSHFLLYTLHSSSCCPCRLHHPSSHSTPTNTLPNHLILPPAPTTAPHLPPLSTHNTHASAHPASQLTGHAAHLCFPLPTYSRCHNASTEPRTSFPPATHTSCAATTKRGAVAAAHHFGRNHGFRTATLLLSAA